MEEKGGGTEGKKREKKGEVGGKEKIYENMRKVGQSERILIKFVKTSQIISVTHFHTSLP